MTIQKGTKRDTTNVRAFLKPNAVIPMSVSVGKNQWKGNLEVHGVRVRKDRLYVWGTLFENGEGVTICLGKLP